MLPYFAGPSMGTNESFLTTKSASGIVARLLQISGPEVSVVKAENIVLKRSIMSIPCARNREFQFVYSHGLSSSEFGATFAHFSN